MNQGTATPFLQPAALNRLMSTPSDLLPVSIGLLILLLWAGATVWLTYRRDERRWDLLGAALLAGMFAAFFGRTISGAVYQPADGGDLVSFLFPIYRFAARTLSQGQLPPWNPHLYGGAPFITAIQAGFLYPPTLLLFLLNPPFDYRCMHFLCIAHLCWSGLVFYALVLTRRRRRSLRDRQLRRPCPEQLLSGHDCGDLFVGPAGS